MRNLESVDLLLDLAVDCPKVVDTKSSIEREHREVENSWKGKRKLAEERNSD